MKHLNLRISSLLVAVLFALIPFASVNSLHAAVQTKTFTVNGVSFTMVIVEGGTFTMGGTSEQGSDAWAEEFPTHQVTLSTYMIGQTEVTQELWKAVMGDNPSSHTGNLKYPVENMSWYDCQDFCIALSNLTGQSFWFPTEAQWEYAARGGKLSKGYKYSGSNDLGAVGWYYKNSSNVTHVVGGKTANELGIYDMSGNVAEYCYDYMGAYSSEAQTDPKGPSSGNYRVYRGGHMGSSAMYCRVSDRMQYIASMSSDDIGFRLALRVYVTGITLNKTSATLNTGQTLQLTATVTPSYANQSLTWSSSDTNVATVSSNGLVTAKGPGEVTIKAMANDGSYVYATCHLTVKQLASGVSLNKTSATINTGQTLQLTATVTPSNTSNKAVTWKSSNTTVATVSSSGLVTAKAPGTATITVTTADGSNKSATCALTVKQLATGVSLNKTSATLNTGQTLQLTATVTPSNTSNKNVTWKSSNTTVATVSSSGLVTAKAPGSATITVTTADGSNKSATCALTVNQLATGVSLNKTSATLNTGQTLQLTATVTPSNTTNKSVTWKSSNTTVATVSSSGLVTAKAPGTATITVTTADGSNKSATCALTVKQLAAGVSLNKTSATLNTGQTLQLTATVTPSNTSNKAVTWKSSNTAVATVSTSGLVTAVGAGTATITVTTADGSNKSATCAITVRQLATGISLNKTKLTMVEDETFTLVATVTPSNTYNKAVTWSSSDPNVASVSDAGEVTAYCMGECVITVTTADGSNKSASCNVVVVDKVLSPYNNYLSSVDVIDLIPGEEIVLPVEMKNVSSIIAVQFDLTLPAGLTLNGDVALEPSRKGADHTVTTSSTTGGLHIMVSSPTNQALVGYQGALLYLNLVAGSTMSLGNYNIDLKNIKLSASSDHVIEPADVRIPTIIVSHHLGDVNADGHIDGTDLNILINIVLGKDNAANYGGRADLDNNGTVDGSDINTLINKLLGS